MTGGVEIAESSPLGNLHLVRRLALPPNDPQRLVINPIVSRSQVGTTTIDLRLGTEWHAMRTYHFHALDPGEGSTVVDELLKASIEEFRLTGGQQNGLVLHPGELLLVLTLEYLHLPNDLWGTLEGRSTWARQGLQVHATAGMVDCGFRGYLTLELQNTARVPLVLYPGLRVAQMAFFPVTGTAFNYAEKRGAAYKSQVKPGSAFTRQDEHQWRHAWVSREKANDAARRAE